MKTSYYTIILAIVLTAVFSFAAVPTQTFYDYAVSKPKANLQQSDSLHLIGIQNGGIVLQPFSSNQADFNTLKNKPNFAPVATSGNYNDLSSKPSLFSGSYLDLTNKPTSNSFSGSYTDLANKPSLFSGSYIDLTNKPSLFSGSYADLTNKPVINSFSGSYTDLTNKPSLFSGSYTDLTNKAKTLSDWASVGGMIPLACNGPASSQALTAAAAMGFDAAHVFCIQLSGARPLGINSILSLGNLSATGTRSGNVAIVGTSSNLVLGNLASASNGSGSVTLIGLGSIGSTGNLTAFSNSPNRNVSLSNIASLLNIGNLSAFASSPDRNVSLSSLASLYILGNLTASVQSAINYGTNFEDTQAPDSTGDHLNGWTLNSGFTRSSTNPISGTYSAYNAASRDTPWDVTISKTVTLAVGQTISFDFKGDTTNGATYSASIGLLGGGTIGSTVMGASGHVSGVVDSGSAGSKLIYLHVVGTPAGDSEGAFVTNMKAWIDNVVIQ